MLIPSPVPASRTTLTTTSVQFLMTSGCLSRSGTWDADSAAGAAAAEDEVLFVMVALASCRFFVVLGMGKSFVVSSAPSSSEADVASSQTPDSTSGSLLPSTSFRKREKEVSKYFLCLSKCTTAKLTRRREEQSLGQALGQPWI